MHGSVEWLLLKPGLTLLCSKKIIMGWWENKTPFTHMVFNEITWVVKITSFDCGCYKTESWSWENCYVDHRALFLFPEESLLFFRARKLLRPTIMNFAIKRAVIKFNGFIVLHWFHILSLTQVSYYWKRWNLPSLLLMKYCIDVKG